MSLVQLQDVERRPSPGLTVNLPSNNPFRNHTASPVSYNGLPSPQSPGFNLPNTAPDRPLSRNPFFDHTNTTNIGSFQQRSISPDKEMPRVTWNGRVAQNGGFMGSTVELFNNLSMDDPQPVPGSHQAKASSTSHKTQGPENVRPFRDWTMPPGHRSSRSQEEEQHRLRHVGKPRPPPQGLDIFADPPETGRFRRPRRNSESSVADKSGRISDLEDERRRRERRPRERDPRNKVEIRRPQTAKPKKPNQKLDLIDQLDVTSIYGTGLFHHDGPFDACNPHRNRKGSQRAPMQAFPKDSANNALGGSGPVHKNIDFAQFHGHGAEGFTDYSTSAANNVTMDPEPYAGFSAPIRTGPGVRPGIDRTTSFNPTAKVEQVHGDESMGLGTSTFLEGAPASRTAIQRRESESEPHGGVFGGGGGLGRKKSLVQKIKGISNSSRGAGAAGRRTSPDASHKRTLTPTSPTAAQGLTAGEMRRNQESRDNNPFASEYDDAYEKKGARIQMAEDQNGVQGGGRSRAMSSPKRAIMTGLLERRVTNDGSGTVDGETKTGGGFLSRVKSLKGGRRARPERRE